MNQRLKSMAAVMLAAMMTVTTNAQVTAPDWENPAVLGINKLPYHATLQLPSKEKACQEIISLDGKWLFHWSKNPDERPVSFYEMNYDVSQWGKITVPGNWQTQGYGIPIYINIDYPFVKNRPSVTTEPPKDWTAYENRNPVGSYVTFIDATEEKPSLYPFSVELQDEKGTVIEHFDYHLGVKKVEVVGEIFKINGKNVKLRGVNRHDHHPKTGRFVDDATYEQDIRLMKQANINFLRTSHYPDRKRSVFIGIYETSLKDYETDYVHPQDNGNRCDVRWFEIASPAGKFRIDGNQPLCIRAWDYGEEDLGVRHPNELPRGRFVNLNIDLDIHGVGGADTWGKRTLAPYTIDGNLSHHYSFILNP